MKITLLIIYDLGLKDHEKAGDKGLDKTQRDFIIDFIGNYLKKNYRGEYHRGNLKFNHEIAIIYDVELENIKENIETIHTELLQQLKTSYNNKTGLSAKYKFRDLIVVDITGQYLR